MLIFLELFLTKLDIVRMVRVLRKRLGLKADPPLKRFVQHRLKPCDRLILAEIQEIIDLLAADDLTDLLILDSARPKQPVPELAEVLIEGSCEVQPAFPRIRRIALGHMVAFAVLFLEKLLEKLIHARFLDMIHIEVRKPADNVIQQHVARSDDAEIIVSVALPVVIENVRDLVKRDRRFSRAGHALHDRVPVRTFADDRVLLVLNGRDNVSEHHILVLREVLDQQLVVGRDITVVVTVQDTLLDIVGALKAQVDVDLCLIVLAARHRHRIAALADLVLVIDLCDRRTPVHDHDLLIMLQTVLTDIQRVLLAIGTLFKVDPSEIRLGKALAVVPQHALHMIEHRDRDRQLLRHLAVKLPVPRGDPVIHLLGLLAHLYDPLLLLLNVAANLLECFLKMTLLIDLKRFHAAAPFRHHYITKRNKYERKISLNNTSVYDIVKSEKTEQIDHFDRRYFHAALS